jgi:predicted nuclease with TOPRIM domain
MQASGAQAHELECRARRLRDEVTEHKSEIRWRRERLHQAKAALARLEETCKQFGIRLIVQE